MLTRVAGSATYPVTLAEAKEACRVDFSDDDELIQNYLEAATDYFDGPTGYLGRYILPQQWQLKSAEFGDKLYLPLSPVQSVDSVAYVDPDGVAQTFEDFTLSYSDTKTWIEGEWPETAEQYDAVTVDFTVGYETFPHQLRAAILILTRHLYDGNEGIPDSVKFLTHPLKIIPV